MAGRRALARPRGTSDTEADLEPGYRLASGRDSAVNAGLRALGVRAAPGQDEYETIGLARHRHTEGWTADPRSSRAGKPAKDSRGRGCLAERNRWPP